MEESKRSYYIEYNREKYARCNKIEKGKILDELCVEFEISRRQGVRLFAKKEVGRPRNSAKKGRKSKYRDAEFIRSLREVWKISHWMCSRHLKVAIPDWLPFIEKANGAFSEPNRVKLLSISAPTIDRILKPYKALKGKSLTLSGGFRDEIPIQGPVWNIEQPGYMETDTVAHCGGSMAGEFINSVIMVDLATLWTEPRAVFGRGSTPVVYAVEDIEKNLPFEILGYDSDNGGEVLNQHILKYFHRRASC